jgi:hypothetical protein
MEQDVVEISLPGFHKDQMRVQVDNQGVLRATGERTVRGGRWARFKKDLCPTGPIWSSSTIGPVIKKLIHEAKQLDGRISYRPVRVVNPGRHYRKTSLCCEVWSFLRAFF